MNADVIGLEYLVFLGAWIIGPTLLFIFHSREGQLPGLLVFAYIFGFFMAHWPGALVHASPWNEFPDSSDTTDGFKLSTYALVAFLAGATFFKTWPRSVWSNTAQWRFLAAGLRVQQSQLSFLLLMAVGITSFVVSLTPLANLPSAAAVLGAGKQCLVLAVCLACLRTWRERNLAQFKVWISSAFALPILTVSTSGFIGYGIAMLGIILMFVAMFYRPRWLLVLGLVIGVYGGLSLWVAYATVREDIREAVWGEQNYGKRFDEISKLVEIVAPFDLSNPSDLAMVDARLNQNWLVGAAIRTTPDLVPFAEGQTFYEAITAVVPRVIWPNKPVTGGSGNYVSRHTGLQFAVGTSVGMGQVLELYINFGVQAVIVGFFLFGLLLRRLDVGLVRGIEAGNYKSIQFYFLVGTGTLQAGGSLAEIVGSMAGGTVLAIALSKLLARRAAPTRLARFEGDWRPPLNHRDS